VARSVPGHIRVSLEVICVEPSTLTRRFAAPSPSGRGTTFKSFPLPLGEGAAKRRVRVEIATVSLSSQPSTPVEHPYIHWSC
jgi:hypothetical protein